MRPNVYTYLSCDEHGNERLRLELVSHNYTMVRSLYAKKSRNIKLNGVKKMHRLTHAKAQEMIGLLKDAKMCDRETEVDCKKVASACTLCAQSVKSVPSRNILLSHVNKAFNENIQADLLIVYIQKKDMLY